MSFLKKETPIGKSRMASALIEELKLVKKAPLNDDDTKRQNLLDFAYHVNLCEGDVEKIEKLVDLYIKLNKRQK